MEFKQALEILGIEEYGERIFNSNSHGELFFLKQYFVLADLLKDIKNIKERFSSWFKEVVKFAEENWERPESIFQHIEIIFYESIQK